MTSDCPVGVVDRRKRLRILAVASVPLVAATVAALGAASKARYHTGQIVEHSTPDLQQGARYQGMGTPDPPRGDGHRASVTAEPELRRAADVPDPLSEPLQEWEEVVVLKLVPEHQGMPATPSRQ